MVFALSVIAALDDEVRVIRSRMAVDARVHVRPALFEVGAYGGGPLVIVRSGVGVEAMGVAARYLLERYRPETSIHIGYCGGADPHYQAGDLIIAEEVVDAASGDRMRPDGALVARAQGICEGARLRARIGTLVTVREAVAAPHEKAFVGTEHGAHGIDMESAAFARACEAAGARYLIVRAVLDPLDLDLPEMEDVLDEAGELDAAALLGHIARRPRDILAIPRIEYFASEARRVMAAFVDAWISNSV